MPDERLVQARGWLSPATAAAAGETAILACPIRAVALKGTTMLQHSSEQPGHSTSTIRRILRMVIRLRPDELATIAERADSCGTPAARYVRETALGVTPRARRTQTNAELIRQLARIGNNLNQIARAVNAGTQIADTVRLRIVLDEIVATIDRVE